MSNRHCRSVIRAKGMTFSKFFLWLYLLPIGSFGTNLTYLFEVQSRIMHLEHGSRLPSTFSSRRCLPLSEPSASFLKMTDKGRVVFLAGSPRATMP